MDSELDSRMGELLQKRKEAIDAGTAVIGAAVRFNMAPKKRGTKKHTTAVGSRKPGTQLVASVLEAKEVAKGGMFCKRKKDTKKDEHKEEDEESDLN